MTTFDKIFILGIGFSDTTKSKVLEYIITGLDKQTEKYYIVTPNPELLVIASRDKSYQAIINNAKLALPDGIGVMLAGQLLGKTLRERIHGVDLVKMLCSEVSKKP